MKFHYSKLVIFEPLLVTAILLLTTPMVLAGPYIPGAGSILQQIKPRMQVVPSSAETGLVIDRGEAGTSTQTKQPCSSVELSSMKSGADNGDNPPGNVNTERMGKANNANESLPPCR